MRHHMDPSVVPVNKLAVFPNFWRDFHRINIFSGHNIIYRLSDRLPLRRLFKLILYKLLLIALLYPTAITHARNSTTQKKDGHGPSFSKNESSSKDRYPRRGVIESRTKCCTANCYCDNYRLVTGVEKRFRQLKVKGVNTWLDNY